MKNLLRLEALALFAIGLFAAAAPQAANEPMTLRLAQSTPMLWPQTRIADGAGLWAKQGLTVKSTLFATGREAMQALRGRLRRRQGSVYGRASLPPSRSKIKHSE